MNSESTGSSNHGVKLFTLRFGEFREKSDEFAESLREDCWANDRDTRMKIID